MANVSDVLRVEVHRRSRATADRDKPITFDIAPIVRRISWSETIAPPWGGIQLTLKTASKGYDPKKLPAPGDWLVVREREGGPAMAFGQVIDDAGGVSAREGGVIASDDEQVSACHWLATLSRALIYATPTKDSEVGTFFAIDRLIGLTKVTFDGHIGHALETFLRLLAYVPMPPSLGGKFSTARREPDWGAAPPQPDVHTTKNVGDISVPVTLHPVVVKGPVVKGQVFIETVDVRLDNSVGVIWDTKSAKALSAPGRHERDGAPSKAADEVPGLALPDVQSLTGAQGASALDIIHGTFGADPKLVEMFGTLEDADKSAMGNLGPPSLALFGHLGRLPVVVFRMRPWRTGAVPTKSGAPPAPDPTVLPQATADALASSIASAYGGSTIPRATLAPARAVMIKEAAKKAPPLFSHVTWVPGRAQHIPQPGSAEDVRAVRVTHRRTLDDHINAATTSFRLAPDVPIGYLWSAGLPVCDKNEVAREGAKLYEANWPFLGGADEDANEKPLRFDQREHPPVVIVLHDTDGWSESGAIATLRAKGLSTNFIIREDGTVTTLADPRQSSLSMAHHTQGAWNPISIGIDLVNAPFASGLANRTDAGPGTSPAYKAREAAHRVITTTWYLPAPKLPGQFLKDTVQIVDYTPEQKTALKQLVADLFNAFPSIPQVVLLPAGEHVAPSRGATAANFKGVIAHGQTEGTSHVDGIRAIEVLHDAGLAGWSS